MSKNYKWGGESVVRNRKGKIIIGADSIEITSPEVTTIKADNLKESLSKIETDLDSFVAFDDHLRLGNE